MLQVRVCGLARAWGAGWGPFWFIHSVIIVEQPPIQALCQTLGGTQRCSHDQRKGLDWVRGRPPPRRSLGGLPMSWGANRRPSGPPQKPMSVPTPAHDFLTPHLRRVGEGLL